jgi:mannose-1-phosphate guanylyltransferase
MKIQYSQDPEPLGTIGPLRLIKSHLNDTFLTVNGDLISDLNVRDFVNFHRNCHPRL